MTIAGSPIAGARRRVKISLKIQRAREALETLARAVENAFHGDEDERFRYAVASSRAVATPARDDDDACEVGGETSTPGEGGENSGC